MNPKYSTFEVSEGLELLESGVELMLYEPDHPEYCEVVGQVITLSTSLTQNYGPEWFTDEEITFLIGVLSACADALNDIANMEDH
tara:strand:+ start:530 stop:784 length:255 start_codon:yes stop_codon:yes gene_type:complete